MDIMDIILESFFEDGSIIGVILTYLFSFGISIATYVLTSYSLYTVANRRAIKHAWLAWLPCGTSWIIGSISDQYQYVVKGRNKSKRKSLLILEILTSVAVIVMLIAVFVPLIQAALTFDGMQTQEEILRLFLSVFGTVMLLYLVVLGLSIAWTVIRYMALFDYYRSCDPGNAEVFLLLSIFVSVAQPILLFIDRKKELGMPPRKTAQPEVSYETFVEDTAEE